MASNLVEKLHEGLLKKLIEDSGLVCIRSRQQSLESELFEGELEEQVLEEEKLAVPETVVEEVQEFIPEEEIKEEEPAVFPSPSLRRDLPDKIRSIEAHNRIHVLPEEFKKDIDPAVIPKIAQTPHKQYIDILAEIVGCKNYKSSLAEFWFLDTLANLLRRAQDDDLNRHSYKTLTVATQAVLILWFCEWMKEMQQFDAADRQRMLRRFKDNMIAAATFAAEELSIPTPDEAGVFYKALKGLSEVTMSVNPSAEPSESSQPMVTFQATAFECCMRDLTKIIHYIFDLFSTDFQYDLVRSVFTFSPEYVLIDSPYQLQIPKRLYAPSKTKPKKEKSPKKDKKGKKKEPDTAEFLALMELKAKEERELEELEDREREEYILRSHVLPLALAGTQDLLDRYWPPPAPPEPEQEPDPPPKPKGKKK